MSPAGTLAVGLLAGCALLAANLLWHLLVRPAAVLPMFGGRPPGDADGAALRALRLVVGALVFVLAAGLGAVVALLAPGWRW